MDGVGALYKLVVALAVPTQPLALVTFTVKVPPLFTVVVLVVAPLLHK